MIPSGVRADMHCHSSASETAKLGIQRSIGLPECATEPEEVYELAKRRGMDFVTITDHDTIDGCLELADRPDCFVSEELTTWFRGEPQAVHVLCLRRSTAPITSSYRPTRETSSAAPSTSHEREITCALAHPFFAVAAPLTPRHRRRLAQLFPIWEIRNGSRARELNRPAAVYVETHGGYGHRRLRRPRRRRHRADVHRDAARGDAAGVSAPRARGPGRVPRRPGQRRQVGARGASRSLPVR